MCQNYCDIEIIFKGQETSENHLNSVGLSGECSIED